MSGTGSDDEEFEDDAVFCEESFLTSKILYRKGLETGLRTGKRWLKTRYALIPQSASPRDVVNFLLEKWRLPRPNLVISIVGGTAKFHMNIKRRDVFRMGMAKAAATTGAWIISCGLNRGIVSTVGEALRDYAVAAGGRRGRANVAAIAITSLREIQSADALIDAAKHDRPVVHTIGPHQATDQQGMLDPNHPYALLIDDRPIDDDHAAGPHQRDKVSEIKLRSSIEYEISTRNITLSSTNVPIVCFLVHGRPRDIRAVHLAVERETPILILAGSKGCADVIATALKLTEIDETSLEKVMMAKFGQDEIPREEMGALVKMLCDIVAKRHLLTIYQLEGTDGVQMLEIDEAFLRTLLKGSQGAGKRDQLHMAVVWRRTALAENHLLKNYKWKSSELFEALRMALVSNQTDFIRLFLNVNVDLEEYLHAGELRRLYNEINEDTLIHRLLVKQRGRKKGPIDLTDVGHVIESLTTHSYEPVYLLDANPILDPHRELFMWAVLQDRWEMARLFWEEGKAWIGGVLVASRIMRAMQSRETEPQKLAELEEHWREYESLALGVLDHCYREDRRRTSMMLIREMPEWGSVSCLCLAAAAHDKHFIAHPAVQNVLNDLWMGRLSRHNSQLETWFATLFPVYALWGITFVDEESDRQYSVTLQTRASKTRACGRGGRYHGDAEDEDDGTRMTRRDSILSDTGSVSMNKLATHAPAPNFTMIPLETVFNRTHTIGRDSTAPQEEARRVPWTKRVPLFFSAPAINFRYYVISHILLLVLYSYVLLIDFHQTPSITEYVLIGWMGTLGIETIRQMMSVGGFYNCQKFIRLWLLNRFYLMDTVSMVMFTVGTVLRFYRDLYEGARIVHALTLVIFYIRLLHIFSVNKHLGPKLIMIMKMISDLLVFICILLVFLLAYGIACQAVLFPHVTDGKELIKGIFYRPYFHIYGELFLDQLEGRNECSNEDPSLEPCPVNTWFGAALLAAYLFLSNVLLLNLLIAMLNYTFAQVQDNTDVVWKFQRYSLIKDYCNRPVLAPPFIIFSHVLIIYSYLLRCWCGCCDRFAISRSLRRKLPSDLIAEISTWERIQGEDYVTKADKNKQVNLHQRMDVTEQKLTDLSRQANVFFTNPHVGSQLRERLDNLETQITEIKNLLLKATRTTERNSTTESKDSTLS